MAVVLVVNSDVPFVHGGHRVLAAELVAALVREGHRATLVSTPSNRFGRTLEAYLANWLTDVGQTGYGEAVDHVISLRYPAFAVRHPRHTAWVIHPMREYYDLWDQLAPTLALPGRIKEELRRRLVHALDRRLLGRLGPRLLCISDTVGERLERFLGLAPTTLHPPAPLRPYRTDAYQPFVLGVSRLHRWKRLDLLVDAVAGSRTLRAVIAGEGPERAALEARARAAGALDRVRFAGAVDDDQLLDLYARTACVFFAPFREDYGFITVEAFMARKPVVTTSDAGGARELVTDGVSGLVLPPDPAVLAPALEALVAEPRRCEELGEAGHVRAARLTWPDAVRRLLGAQP